MKNQIARIPLKAVIALVFTVFSFTSTVQAQDGAKLFKQNCAYIKGTNIEIGITTFRASFSETSGIQFDSQFDYFRLSY